jgi:hypothetical protein
MNDHIADRLRDLIATAEALQQLLRSGRQVPPFALARLALLVDWAAGKLEAHAERLAGAAPPKRGKRFL